MILSIPSTWDDPGLTFRSDYFACQTDDSHEFPVTQLTGHSTKDSCPPRVSFAIEDHDGVPGELDIGTIRTASRLATPNDDTSNDRPLFDCSTRNRLHNAQDNDVTEPGDNALPPTWEDRVAAAVRERWMDVRTLCADFSSPPSTL